ncbi:hypothetical protein U1Q18_034597 [Sarracenia purpurea var. burkii]
MQLGRSLFVLGLMSPVGQRVCLLVFKQWGFMSVGMLGGTVRRFGPFVDKGSVWGWVWLWLLAGLLGWHVRMMVGLSSEKIGIVKNSCCGSLPKFCSGDWVLWSVSCWFFSGFVASPEGRVMPFLVAVCGVVWVVGLLDVGCGCVVVMLLLAAWCELLGEGGVGGVWVSVCVCWVCGILLLFPPFSGCSFVVVSPTSLCGLFSLFAGRTLLLLLWRLAQCCLLRDGLPYGFCCCSGVFLIDEALEAQLVWNPPSYEVVEACVGYGMRGVGIPQSLVSSISLWRFPLFFSIPLLAILCGIKRETGKSDGQLWVGDYELGLQKNITAAA